MVILTNNLVKMLMNMFPTIKLDVNKWKIVVSMGDKNRNSYIDVEYLFNQIGNSDRLTVSHPKI